MVFIIKQMVNIEFQGIIKDMAFEKYLDLFGVMFNQAQGRHEKWKLWDKQREVARAYDEYKIIWEAKQRQLGASEEAGQYAIKVCVGEPRSEVIVMSKDATEAAYFLRRRVKNNLDAMVRIPAAQGVPYPFPEYKAGAQKIEFENGSWIEIASSDNREVISRTPRLIIFDEVKTFSKKDADELWAGMLPSIAEQPHSQIIVISTGEYGTWFNEMTERIMKGEIEGIHLIDMFEGSNPNRTPEWYSKQKKKYSEEVLFYREYCRDWNDFFASRSGAVWPHFDENPGGRHVNFCQPDFKNHQYYIIYDHGFQHLSATLFCTYDKHSNHLYVFDELALKNKMLPEISMEIRKKMNFYRMNYGAPGRPYMAIADSHCFAKMGTVSIGDTLSDQTGLYFRKSDKHDLMGAVARISVRMVNGGLTIHPQCATTIKQVRNLRWRESDGKETPVDVDNDFTDCLAYLENELIPSIRAVPKEEPDLLSRIFKPKMDYDAAEVPFKEEDLFKWQAL